MGSLILCHEKKAKIPYEITRVHKKIYSIEELCYYLVNYLYLIDYTIMNHALCGWIDRELGMSALATELRFILAKNGSEATFIAAVLEASNIYLAEEIAGIEVTLAKLKDQKEVEREKFKADTLLQSGEYDAAILVYQGILGDEHDETVSEEFYASIYASLGSCYGNQFLYQEAAGAYKEAYRVLSTPSILRAYLYSCYRSLPEVEYVKMLSGNSEFLAMDKKMKEEMSSLKKMIDLDVTPEKLAKWKEDYRKFDT
ncbi:tetratricopeptide (TPR) repeat protein [Lachnospiraceae bacterium PF1-21]|uniref:Tetratricopeptide repeat protein n=1 Tax=Ohessyouella blattaphilus TaxID=2949333 RepID=A0ABT1EHA7_9FIRM|nr:hypothetical protein [Ohessyouella blattaphilus]MCP1109879.1 hypothetical protein [Ohessyouella blattaphilus]MCR8563273.1 hypothetical protein [Ohessyouella blattaphilus]